MKYGLSKIAILSLVLVVSSALCQQAEQPSMNDADNLGEAAGEVYTQSLMLSQEMAHCQKTTPDKAFDIQLADYLWHARNYNVTLAAEKVLGDQGKQRFASPIQTLANTANAALDAVPQGCYALATKVLNGEQDVKTALPKAYGFLIQVYSTTPEFVALTTPKSFEDGCVIQYARTGGRDFAVGLAHCGCLRESFVALSQQEQVDFVTHAKDPAYVYAAPWVSRFRENAKACLAARHIP